MSPREWQRGWRVAAYWLGSFLILMVLLAITFGVMHLLSLDACGTTDSKDVPPACAPLMSLALSAALIGGVLLAHLPIVAFLKRELSPEMKPRDQGITAAHLPLTVSFSQRKLGLGQELLRGRIEIAGGSGRTLSLSGVVLTLWSLYPFQKGWIRPGVDFALVCQHVPFSGITLLLAFCDGRSPVRGVAIVTQSVSLFIAATCIAFFSRAAIPFGSLFLAVSGRVAVLDLVYLGLALRAKINWRSAIDGRGV